MSSACVKTTASLRSQPRGINYSTPIPHQRGPPKIHRAQENRSVDDHLERSRLALGHALVRRLQADGHRGGVGGPRVGADQLNAINRSPIETRWRIDLGCHIHRDRSDWAWRHTVPANVIRKLGSGPHRVRPASERRIRLPKSFVLGQDHDGGRVIFVDPIAGLSTRNVPKGVGNYGIGVRRRKIGKRDGVRSRGTGG